MGRDRIFPLGDPPDYEPAPDDVDRGDGRAAAASTPSSCMYDLLLADDGRELLLRPLVGYSDLTLDPVREMLLHPSTVLGVGDGGAHVRRDLRRVDADVDAHPLGRATAPVAPSCRSRRSCTR